MHTLPPKCVYLGMPPRYCTRRDTRCDCSRATSLGLGRRLRLRYLLMLCPEPSSLLGTAPLLARTFSAALIDQPLSGCGAPLPIEEPELTLQSPTTSLVSICTEDRLSFFLTRRAKPHRACACFTSITQASPSELPESSTKSHCHWKHRVSIQLAARRQAHILLSFILDTCHIPLQLSNPASSRPSMNRWLCFESYALASPPKQLRSVFRIVNHAPSAAEAKFSRPQ